MDADRASKHRTLSERLLDQLGAEARLSNVLVARQPRGAGLEVQIARELAQLPNGRAVLEAMALEYESRIRFRMLRSRQDTERPHVLEAQLLEHTLRFFERVERRYAELLRAAPDAKPAG